MRHTDGMEEIKVVAPTPGSCPICATVHDARDPHDRDSLYYQNRFYRHHKRFPTWQDAMNHCSEITRVLACEKLAKRGIVLEDGAAHE